MPGIMRMTKRRTTLGPAVAVLWKKQLTTYAKGIRERLRKKYIVNVHLQSLSGNVSIAVRDMNRELQTISMPWVISQESQ
mmetsp:Transcript_4594/g.13680  ORF Transcript_4594/g.13680 Transcript_4594/m.13680 type:complete len:80 (+) Transcript_4594:4782-5021(+)